MRGRRGWKEGRVCDGESVPVIGWEDFTRVQLCAGTVLRVEPFPEARRPAWKLWVDFGPHGVKKTSAQIRALYAPEDLVGRQIVGVLNFLRSR